MEIRQLPPRRRITERIARAVLLASASFTILILTWLLWRIASEGVPLLDLDFFTNFASRRAEDSGIKAALAGSAWLAVLTMGMALPIGVLAGIYMNEYARPNAFTRFLRLIIANLAGVPSIVFGILGLAIFVRYFGLGNVLLAGALTLAVLSLPVIIVATEEALKSVPQSMREAAYGLGATKWQVTKDHVLPYAIPGIMTGSILALARAVGETAPLIVVGAATAIYTLPDGPTSQYTALPMQTYVWAQKPQLSFRELASAATVVLLGFILTANLIAIVIRNHFQRRLRW